MDPNPTTPDSASTDGASDDDVAGHLSFRPGQYLDPDHTRAQGLPFGTDEGPAATVEAVDDVEGHFSFSPDHRLEENDARSEGTPFSPSRNDVK